MAIDSNLISDPRFAAANRTRRLQDGDHPPYPEYHSVEGKPVMILSRLTRRDKGFKPQLGPQFLVQFPDGTKRPVAVSEIKIVGNERII